MRVLVICDIQGPSTGALIRATLTEATSRADLDVVGFATVNPNMAKALPGVDLRRVAIRVLEAAVSRRRPRDSRRFDLSTLAAKRELPLFLAESSVNDVTFLDQVFEAIEPDVLFNINGVQIFDQVTLDRFADTVNYHDGLLPQYAGRSATSQSVYRGEAETGFTFHRITAAVDAGPILVQGSVPTTGTPMEVHARKVDAAVAQLPRLFDALAAGDAGEAQIGSGSCFSRADYLELTTIKAPESLASSELLRRDSAFHTLTITIDGRAERVTSLTRSSEGKPFAFRGADGLWLQASTIKGIPARLIARRRRFRH